MARPVRRSRSSDFVRMHFVVPATVARDLDRVAAQLRTNPATATATRSDAARLAICEWLAARAAGGSGK